MEKRATKASAAADLERIKSARKQRLTLRKQIAGAPTHAKKWEIALHGGEPPTAIQNLPLQSSGLDAPSPHGEEWRLNAIAQLKQRFAELLIPALMANDTRPFEELIAAMQAWRKTSVLLPEFIRRQELARKKRPSKKEIGRRLRLALLNLNPDDLLNIRTVRAALSKVEESFATWHGFDFSLASDDSKIYAVMRELKLRFLRPGDAAHWIHNEKVVRILSIQPNEEPKVSGMTLKQLKSLPYLRCERNFP